MKLLFIVVVVACALQNNGIVVGIPNEVQPNIRFLLRIGGPLNCDQFEHDYDVLSSFPFVTQLNPLTESDSKTFGRMDDDEKVIYLNIANQKLLPNTVFCLKHLRELYVRSTSFYQFGLDDDSVRQLPGDIARLSLTLQYLGIYDTTISHLPNEIGKLTRLKGMELSNVGLIALPDSIGDLAALTTLHLPKNKLTELPTTMFNLRSLTQLKLDNNPKLRSVKSLHDLPDLQYLDTTNCPIEKLPLNLPSLDHLYMTDNNLTDLVGIGSLGTGSQVNKHFIFNLNHIRFMPPQIRAVRNLERLELNHNQLMTLPIDIFNINTLRYLDIRNNLFMGSELKAIKAKFEATNPSLQLVWSNVGDDK